MDSALLKHQINLRNQPILAVLNGIGQVRSALNAHTGITSTIRTIVSPSQICAKHLIKITANAHLVIKDLVSMEMSVALQRMKAHPHKLDVIYGIKSP